MFDPKTKILVVEDVEMMRELLLSMLKDLGFSKMEVATDGEDAWLKLNEQFHETEPFELVISDLEMPNSSGIELLGKIRKNDRFKHLPFIILTASADKQLVMSAIRIGVSQYIIKPFDISTFHEKLKISHRDWVRSEEERAEAEARQASPPSAGGESDGPTN